MSNPIRLLSMVLLAVLHIRCTQGDDTLAPNEASGTKPNSAGHKPLSDDPQKATSSAAAFSYRAAGRRDPFRSYLLDAAARRQAETSQRRVEETEAYELGQYHLTAVLTGTSQPKAMVEDPTGKAYVVRIGARLGRSGGRVSRIDSGGLQVLEETLDPQGLRSQVPISLKLPAADNDEPGLGATP